MKTVILAAAAASLIPLAGVVSAPALADPPAWAPAHGKRAKDRWYADDYYRKGNYRERRLAANEEIYRGRDGRYYCKRKDGTTGLIVGGIAGGVLGHEIAPGGSKTVGAVLGAVAGGLLGKSLDDGVKCR
jgi:outer membrane lipoprotein SlyB